MERKQFAEKVVAFSSQYGAGNSRSYTAGNLAGDSYNFPGYGDFTQAFVLVSTMQFMESDLIVYDLQM